MPGVVGLDASFVVGLLDDRDLWHAPAMQLYAHLQARSLETAIFDCVLAEAISALSRRIHEKRRTSDLKALLERARVKFPTKEITWLYPELPALYEDVVALVEESNGELNFSDALIALSCQKRHIELLASFDPDFDRVAWLQRIARPDQVP